MVGMKRSLRSSRATRTTSVYGSSLAKYTDTIILKTPLLFYICLCQRERMRGKASFLPYIICTGLLREHDKTQTGGKIVNQNRSSNE